jgi:hypothetical protein
VTGPVTRAPAPIVPKPAAAVGDLRGRRLIVGLPGHGWRADLRGDAAVVQGSRTYVPVLTEHEWYRAEAEQIEVFAPLVPIERVWVELVGSTVDEEPPRDLISRLVSLDAPPPRRPVPAVEWEGLTGRRVVRAAAGPEDRGQERRDLRAVTEAYTSAGGEICVRVADELEWYRWAWTGQAARTMEVPVHLLWVE